MHAHADHSHSHSHSGGHPHGSGSDCHGPHDAHGHHHAPKDFGRAFALGIGLNVAFVVIEASAGLLYNSMALVADAGHNLSDVLALMLAWVASIAARRPPSGRFTYGFKSSTIL
ncbi:MAG TPA: cation transporter, partial [Erythrobacter sp.]|nr:cation transporter [Erythrobacter sp.]